jgi:hypothetical protein
MNEKLSRHADSRGSYASRLILRSFQLSRGVPNLQTLFLEFAGSTHPERFTSENITDSRAFCVSAATRFISKGGHVLIQNPKFHAAPAAAITGEVNNAIWALQKGIDSGRAMELNVTAPSRIIGADARWMPFSTPPEPGLPVATAENGYRSNFVDYVLLGRDAGMDVVNEFYATSKDIFDDAASRDVVPVYLEEVIDAHQYYNPDDIPQLANVVAVK